MSTGPSSPSFVVLSSPQLFSSQIDFREFALALWNYCTLGRAALILFALDRDAADGGYTSSCGEVAPRPNARKRHCHLDSPGSRSTSTTPTRPARSTRRRSSGCCARREIIHLTTPFGQTRPSDGNGLVE
jgi:hypothetical protein